MKVLVIHAPEEAEAAEVVHTLIKQWMNAFAEYRSAEVARIEEPHTAPAMIAGGTLSLADHALAAKEEASQ